MKRLLIAFFMFSFSFMFLSAGSAEEGLVSVKSAHSVQETTRRLESALKKKGMTLFITIDHAAGAKKAGKELPPTRLVIFGNPKVGTPLMRCARSSAIDLPQKALIWEDEKGQVWFSYNNPEYIAKRHGMKGCGEWITKIEKALKNFATKATAP